jgi:hypothetical protein
MERNSLNMLPPAGTNQVKYIGDRIRFELAFGKARAAEKGVRAFLRTNIGRAGVLRQ